MRKITKSLLTEEAFEYKQGLLEKFEQKYETYSDFQKRVNMESAVVDDFVLFLIERIWKR